MATLAGQMANTVQANPQWHACNGQPVYVLDPKQPRRTAAGTASYGDQRDYVRRVGHQGRRRGLGPLGWIVCLPYDPAGAWNISLADDNTETALTPPVPWPGKPPAGVK